MNRLWVMLICAAFLCGMVGGCAGAVVKPGGKVVGYAIGEAEISTGGCVPVEAGENQPAACEPAGDGVRIKGAHPAAGWFEALRDIARAAIGIFFKTAP